MTFAPYPASPLALDSPTIAAWVAAQLAQMRPGDKLRELLRGRASGHAAPLVAWYASAGERQLQIRVDSPNGKGEVLALERRDLSSAALAGKLQTLALRGGLDGWENPALARRPTGPGLWAAPSMIDQLRRGSRYRASRPIDDAPGGVSALAGSSDFEAICSRGLVIFVASDGRYVPASRETLREPAAAWRWRRLDDVGADWTPLVGLDREALERPVWAHVEEALRRRAATLAYSPAPAAPKPSGPAVGDVVGPAQIPPGAVVQHPSRDTYLARDTRPLVVATEEGPCDKDSWWANFEARDRQVAVCGWLTSTASSSARPILALGLPVDATAQQARVAAGLERRSVLALEAALARAEELIGAEGFATLREVAASPVDVARGVNVRSTTGSHDRAQVRVERGQAQLDAACTCNRCAEIAAVLPREAARRIALPADPRERLAALVALVAESPSVALTLAPWARVQAAIASTGATHETPKARPYGWLPRTGGRESGRLAAGLAVSRDAFDLRTLRLGDLELREVAPWIWRVEREAAGLALCKGSTTQALSGMDALARLAGRPSLAEEQEAECAAVMSYEQAAATLGPAFASAPPELFRGIGERRIYYVNVGQAAIALPRGGRLRLWPRADAVVVVCLADWSRSPAQAGVARVEREAVRHVRRNCGRATIVVALDLHQRPIAWVGPTDEPCRV